MTEERGAAFLGFDEDEARRVEAIYQTSDVVAQRARVLDAMALQRGERIVDLGCGPGLLAIAMGPLVGPEGEVQCLDASENMIALARRRCAGLPWVQPRIGDVVALPYAAESFDVAVCTQVFEYVPEIERALAELHRVLKPRGRAVIVDTDWESSVWHSSDPARMRRTIEAWDQHCPHPQLPRTLAVQLRAVGLEVLRVDAITLINDSYPADTYSAGMIPLLAAYAKKHRLMEEKEVDAWVADLLALGQQGEYFFSLNRYLFSARKPEARKSQ